MLVNGATLCVHTPQKGLVATVILTAATTVCFVQGALSNDPHLQVILGSTGGVCCLLDIAVISQWIRAERALITGSTPLGERIGKLNFNGSAQLLIVGIAAIALGITLTANGKKSGVAIPVVIGGCLAAFGGGVALVISRSSHQRRTVAPAV